MMAVHFEEVPSVKNLFRAVWGVIRSWTSARVQAHRYKKLDFRPLREDEITDEIRAETEAVLPIPQKNLHNI